MPMPPLSRFLGGRRGYRLERSELAHELARPRRTDSLDLLEDAELQVGGAQLLVKARRKAVSLVPDGHEDAQGS